jgi:hypothetical protein
MKNEKIDYLYLKNNGLILYDVISGSKAYGTNLPTSDEDRRYIYILPLDYILSGNIIEQINDVTNDVVGYEIGRFLELLYSNNPNILELLNTPEDCIIYKNPVFDIVLNNRDKFLTKKCAGSFSGYAKEQIYKAKGKDKKQNWEKEKITRKTPLDFCFIFKGENSIPLINYMNKRNLDQKFAGLSKIPHSKDVYALFYDYEAASIYSDKSSSFEKLMTIFTNKIPGFKTPLMRFKGISFQESNDIRLSSIPISCPSNYFIGHISYNKDAYIQHCKDYKSYQTWLNERNEQRWVDVESNGQKIDGKNMMHCRRLIDMSREIAEGKGIIVKRPNAQELIDIRKGKVDLQSLIDHIEKETKEIDILYKNSTLPENIDIKIIEDILIDIRYKIYKIK